MKWFFKDVNISRKFAIVFIIFLFLIGFGGSVGIYNATQIFKVTKRLYISSFKRLESLSGLEGELLSARQEIFLYAMVRDPSTRSFLEIRVSERKKTMDAILRDYLAMGLSDEDKALYDLMLKSLDDFWLVHNRVFVLSQAGEREKAISTIQMEGNKTFTSAMNNLTTLVGMSRGGALSSYERSGFFSRIIIAVTFAFTISAIALAIGLWLMLRRSIVAPILAIEKSARSIASGDFTGRVPVINDDEIGSLAVEFNYMTKKLHEYYTNLESKVRERTEELRGANEELQGKHKELELANIELSEASKMKNEFLANVSHELRTPLNSILGFSELLEEKSFGELNDKQGQYVQFIHSSGEQLLRLINNIIDLSKIDVDKMEFIPEFFTINEALGEVLGIIRPLAHEKNISIKTKIVPASPKMRADKAKFKKVLLNVLNNAVKFNRQDGSIEISWQVTEETRARGFKSFVTFSVKDTGIGIKSKDKDKLFNTFKQADTSFDREYDGIGLGLVLTKRLIELHGGSIRFESEEGRGSTFYLKFPQGTEDIDLPSVTDYMQLDDKGGGKPLILLASESPDINHLIMAYMADGPYEILSAADGLELLKMSIEKQPFAIIMGISLHGKDGWEVLKELKSKSESSHIPVIVVSSSENSELSLTLGAMAHIGKSLNKERLFQALNSI